MSLLKNHVTQLAFSVTESKGVFAVLLGSGLSRAAEIPTGWEITLDLVRRVALAQGVEEQSDWAAWYRETTGEEPNYSSLLEGLASSPEERRAILHSYIEPTLDDRAASRKIPTVAHRAIADLVQGGYVRVIITTNFDRLMENALRERGIEPTIISSVDALAGAEPITHSACYILKLHGDYKDARILNTESELSGYPAQYDALLDRIFDEHGLIVCGWSGEWDHALRSAFLRAPNRRYSVFWAARGELGSGAQDLVDHRRARVIPIMDADSFFSTLQQHVETLSQSQRQNPFSIELLTSSAKRFLSKSEYRIQLDDLLTQEVARLVAQLNSNDLAQPSSWGDKETFRLYVKRYEAASEALATVCGVLGRWGDDSELPLVIDIILALYAHAKKVGGGFVSYLGLRSYPALLIFTAYGLGLTRAGRWGALHKVFNTVVEQQHSGAVRVVEALFLWAWDGDDGDTWKQMEGLETRKTALSDYLLSLFSEWSKPFMGVSPDFELIFERYEILASLAYLEREDKEGIRQSLARDPSNGWVRMPVGRSGWHTAYASRLISEIQTEPMKTELLQAGFARKDADFAELFIKNFQCIARRMQW